MDDREERVTRLTASARERSAQAHASAQRAITSLDARGLPVTFAAVAREANVSLAFVYKDEAIADRVRGLRGKAPSPRAPRPSVSPSERALRTKLDAAVERNRELEKEVEQLRKENRALLSRLLDRP